jgi:hypothetical protein
MTIVYANSVLEWGGSMGGRRVRWLAAWVASALVGAVLPTGLPAADASVATGQAAPARASATTAGRLKITPGPAVETLQGPAMTLTLPGGSGDYLRVNSFGAVGVSAPDGHTVWQLPASSLLADWQLRLTSRKDGRLPRTRRSRWSGCLPTRSGSPMRSSTASSTCTPRRPGTWAAAGCPWWPSRRPLAPPWAR